MRLRTVARVLQQRSPRLRDHFLKAKSDPLWRYCIPGTARKGSQGERSPAMAEGGPQFEGVARRQTGAARQPGVSERPCQRAGRRDDSGLSGTRH